MHMHMSHVKMGTIATCRLIYKCKRVQICILATCRWYVYIHMSRYVHMHMYTCTNIYNRHL